MNSNDLEMKSDVLSAIQVVLDKRTNELTEGIVSVSYLSTLKRKERSHNRKTLRKILNNQGIPFSFYEIICDFESVIKEKVKCKKRTWMCLLLATLGIIFKNLHNDAKEKMKLFFNLDLPDIDYEEEIMKEYNKQYSNKRFDFEELQNLKESFSDINGNKRIDIRSTNK